MSIPYSVSTHAVDHSYIYQASRTTRNIMSLRKETEGLVPSLSAHLYSQNGQFTPVPGSPYTKKEARAALIH